MKAKAGDRKMAKRLSKPTAVFEKSPKKPERDDMPGKMKGGKQPGNLARKLAGRKI